MKPKDPLDNYKKKRKLKKRGDEWNIDSDHPIHERYTKLEPIKKYVKK